MDLRRRVGLNLQKIRHDKGFSQEELADRAKVHQTYLSGVEQGKRNATLMVIEKIAMALGIDPEELLKKRGR